MPAYENPFYTLGLHPKVVKEIADSKLAELIEAQYKAMSKIHHPDRGGDPERFRLIREAYDDLQDPLALKSFVREYRAAKRDQVEVVNDRLVDSMKANTAVLSVLSEFVKSIGSENALANLAPGWIFAGHTPGGITSFEVGENHLITAARQYETQDQVNFEFFGDEPIPTGYYFARDGLLVAGVQKGKSIELVAHKPQFKNFKIQNGFWYQLGILTGYSTQLIAEIPQLGRAAALDWRPVFMVTNAKTEEENANAEFMLAGQLQAKPSKSQRRRGIEKDTPDLQLERVYAQLEPLPTIGADLFVRNEEGKVFSLQQARSLMKPMRGFEFIIPPKNEG